MESFDKIVVICGCLLICLTQFSMGKLMGAAIMKGSPPPPGAQCSSWWGCNKKNTRCMEYPDGCGSKHFKTCQCMSGYFLVDNVCKEFKEVTEKCKLEDSICPGTCTQGVCKCPNDIYSKNKEMCGRNYEEPCTNNGECSTVKGNATCKSGVCGCAPGLAYVVDHKKCLPKSGGACVGPYQCYGEQNCVSGACRCPTGQKWDGESFSCIGSNALSGIPKGDDCTASKTEDSAKVCAFGLHCFACDPLLPSYKCVKLPNAASQLGVFSPLFALNLLILFAL